MKYDQEKQIYKYASYIQNISNRTKQTDILERKQ